MRIIIDILFLPFRAIWAILKIIINVFFGFIGIGPFLRDWNKYSRLLNITFLQFTEIMKQCEDDYKIPKDVAFKIIETRTNDLHELVKNGESIAELSQTERERLGFSTDNVLLNKKISREMRYALAILQIYNNPPLGGWERILNG